ncbi:integrator complex subunit 3 homolog [Pseudophryne corroboree]|uniref:integrator complex subunit 3 homolog n=1 Tax=Pseudophryne corroboree TaxID=495146 RepID=UPI00308153E8
MGTKRRRVEAEYPPASSPPQRRISTVSSQPPQAILASPQSEEPQSPQLSEPPIIPEDTQQETDLQESYTLHLQEIDPNQPTTPQDITQTPQTSHSPQLSPTRPQPQMGPEFWSSWATQQAQHYACLNTHSQYLASLPHHLPRLSRNSGRLIVQVGRVSNSMVQMRADNSQMHANLQRIMDDQQRQQQALIQIIQHNQLINESLSRIIANNTAATTQLTASLNNLSQSLNVLASHQLSSSSGTTTPSQTPVTSPVRRSSRTRTNEPSQSSAPSKQKTKK